ncbi:hypothetical protein IHE44_0013681 [Lamprotornis superbus]|uniref:Protein delta homolog 1 n=1 Tax=Lamprotornis superbus TaxID=245042 RepID=A0A835U1R7_9PASS|nr:hypothetical protein IHE44_0013681 [Lamprotornis superbus]
MRVNCKAGCHPENGFCEFPSECRCQPGWQGALCNECVPFPGCLHGSCAKPWQCICEEGWVGSLCDIDIHPCSAKPCTNNSTCIETGDGGYICLCAQGFTGKNCHLKKGPCIINGSPCQNGGTCIDDNGFAPHASCLCPSGFAGNFCEIDRDDCESNPCENGGTCTDVGVGFSCSCPHGYTGKLCSSRVTLCASGPCENGGTCSEHPQGGFECICKPEFVGVTCKHPSKNTSLSGMNMETKHVQNYKPPSKAHHRPVHQQQEILKITVKETIQNADPLLSRSQVICFVVLGLLTCLVVLGTTGIVFFSKCEMWLANAKYSHLLRKKKNFFLKSNNGENLSEPGWPLELVHPSLALELPMGPSTSSGAGPSFCAVGEAMALSHPGARPSRVSQILFLTLTVPFSLGPGERNLSETDGEERRGEERRGEERRGEERRDPVVKIQIKIFMLLMKH